ncbi:nitrous oxide reductase accessory protein NosL [Haloferax sp. MBLA0076]|uniref:Nitrous oxide reductase accessory protein NosL n=1 Tax=Haloferax litoreum TaxID=2666140 RepID=A0A6A8GLC8_9EURY|nr:MULTISPECIES: nitrous oxide reductase accessory protein NosL [Haloferax]KAB1189851.1 nitrous oxide reductase accessory protein NosL [Haloferax sp. CBA1148]MRX23611.1 nitrous oxide reductase accessory protein NosL [Haloferax litoreum]
MCQHCDSTVSRRSVLSATGAIGVASLAGCLGGGGGSGNGDVPAAIALTGNKQCDVCGMIIEQHPGPVGQLFYADNAPEGHDNPAWFCSAWETFAYNFDRENEGWTLSVGYLTDYSSAEYELYDDGGSTFIDAHLEPEAFGRMDELFYVAGTDVKGAMGNDLIPFSDETDADTFADDHGGVVYRERDISRDLLAQL